MRDRWLARAAERLARCVVLAVMVAAPGIARAQESPQLPETEEPAAAWVALSIGAFFPHGSDAAGAIGYAVLDEPNGPPFWSGYIRLGEVQLGPAVSRPFGLPDARVYQVFEHATLRWTPGSETVEIADSLDLLWAAGRDPWLVERGVPPVLAPQAELLTRFAWLTDDVIRDVYFGTQLPGLDAGLPAALARYGLPASEPAERDGLLLQRFDKALLARDLATGVVTTLPVGALLRDSGVLSAGVLSPDRIIGGHLVPRAPRTVLSWPNARGWGIAEPPPLPTPAPTTAATPTPPSVPQPPPTPTTPAAQPSPTSRPSADRAQPTPTAPAAAPQPGAALVVKAVVNQGRAEHVLIANDGTAAQELTGWLIRSGTGGQQIAFPAGFVLAPGAAVRVHSGSGASALHRPPTDLFGTGTNVWNNAGDHALLVDPTGRVVSQISYVG